MECINCLKGKWHQETLQNGKQENRCLTIVYTEIDFFSTCRVCAYEFGDLGTFLQGHNR
jgi:hypothetical protein